MQARHRVLVIEDEDDIRNGVVRWLTAAGYDTELAVDGLDGLQRATARPPDAILLDMLMPRMDGLQTLNRLQASRETASIPVVMLSASLRDEQQALDAGARFFVHKPYDHNKLVTAVRAVIK